MSNLLQILKWHKKDTYIHRLDPRTKIIWCLLTIAFSIISLTIETQLIILTMIIIFMVIAKSLTRFIRALWSIFPLILLIVALNYIYLGLYYTIVTSLRLINILTAFSAFSLSTNPDDLSAALIKFRLPYSFALMLVASIHYSVILNKDFSNIIDAYKARGFEFEGSFIKKIKNYAIILVPLIVCTINRSLKLAEAMEARGFNPKSKRTYYNELSFNKNDFLFLLVSFLFFLSILFISNMFRF
ncbi:MAG: energy-coupling factor transporter transmembrane protein EcfT [Candidatus Verstraetearchaeota archaeon]|nr:energy-coupling factor transporter transmembrane protein EcfT [Candidatus Verstraetearchaeota archaeon]